MALGYERVARVYDGLGRLYSLGAILRTQISATEWVREGDRVLLAGSGTAPELEGCATPGVSWTVLDASAAMLDLARRRRLPTGQRAEFVHSALETYSSDSHFDLVLAPFFLNVFPSPRVPEILTYLARKLRPGGRLVVADFASGGSWGLNLVRRLYYLPPLVLFWLLARNPWHELYDYAQIADAARVPLRLTERRAISVLGVPLFETLTFTATSADGGAA